MTTSNIWIYYQCFTTLLAELRHYLRVENNALRPIAIFQILCLLVVSASVAASPLQFQPTYPSVRLATAAHFNTGGEDKMIKSEVTKISYRFVDASVPPDYHRSFIITVTADKVHVVVDCYGEILTDETCKITSRQFDGIKLSFEKNRIENCKLGQDEDCTGGTSESIFCSENEKKIFSGAVYHCGGENTGNLCGDVTRFAEDVKKLVPDLDTLIAPEIIE